MEYELVVGLEVHCQLNTKTKAFCGCSTSFGKPANENVCPVCLALPGALPILNKHVLESAMKLGIATNCTIAPHSYMARKNYFYPDLPKGYQISQSDFPICQEGYVDITSKNKESRRIRLLRIHIEEDAGKSIHDIGKETYIDANRCGVPLLEIVSYPDLRSTEEVSLYLQKIRQAVRYLEISDGNMEEGSLRCDANVSLRPKGSEKYGTRTEIKNMNSFKSVEKAIEYEVERQREVLESGGTVSQETRLWDADKLETRVMRSKEDSHDYRYFPEPDLLSIHIDTTILKQVQENLPEMPEARSNRFVSNYHIPPYDAEVLTVDKKIADYYEEVVKISSDAKASSNWVMGEVMRELKEKNIDIQDFSIHPKRLGNLLSLIHQGVISNTIAKQVFELMRSTEDEPAVIVTAHGLAQVSNTDEIEKEIEAILKNNASQVVEYKSGKNKLFGFFVGEVMKQMKGKANPKLLNDILKQKLDN